MVRENPKLKAGARTGAKREGWYRGIKLHAPSAGPKTSEAKLQRAVENALAKNADALARGK
jgi:hypothetical protein